MENGNSGLVEYSCSECNSVVGENDLICPKCSADLSGEIINEPEKENNDNEKLLNLASAGRRFSNDFLDNIFTQILMYMFFIPIVLILKDVEPVRHNLGFIGIIFFLLIIGLQIFYYIIPEYKFQKTLAKYITKTKVVNIDGLKPDLESIVIRTLCRFIPFDAFSFLNDDCVGWHDKLSKTRVIND